MTRSEYLHGYAGPPAPVGLTGWKVARRNPDTGAGVLVCGILLGVVPISWFVG